MFVLFLFFLLFNGSKSFINSVSNCKGNEHPGNWTCFENEDDTVNVTLDCDLNEYKSSSLWIWSEKFPPNIKVLTVKNCDEVVLEFMHERNNTKKSVSHLQVLNVSKLTLIKEIGGPEPKLARRVYSWPFIQDELQKKIRNYDASFKPIGFLTSHADASFKPIDFPTPHVEPNKNIKFPHYMVFKDIGSMTVKDSLIIISDGNKSEDYRIESIKLINSTVERLHNGLIGDATSLKELLLQNVTILKSDYEPIFLLNKNATIKIINSTFDLILQRFLLCDVSKLIIEGNVFQEISKVAFECETDEFVFSGNTVENLPLANFLTDNGLAIQSRNVNVHGNIFYRMAHNAFYTVTAMQKLNGSRRIFNFSNNEIRAVEISSSVDVMLMNFAIPPGLNKKTLFDTYYVLNNSVECSCENLPWFHDIAEGRKQAQRERDYLYFPWINSRNPNKCLNIPNCTLNQVIYNYLDLCVENYQCPVNVSEDSNPHYRFNFLSEDKNWKDLISSNKKIADSVDKLLKVATDGGKKFLFGNSYGGDQEKVLSVLTIIAVCIIANLILICIIYFTYSKAIGFGNFPCAGRRRKRFDFCETEAESQIALHL